MHGEGVCREGRERGEGVRGRDWDRVGVRGKEIEEVGGVRGEETEEEVGRVRGEETEEGESGRGEGRAGRAWEEATGDDRLCTTEMKQENTHYFYLFNRCSTLYFLCLWDEAPVLWHFQCTQGQWTFLWTSPMLVPGRHRVGGGGVGRQSDPLPRTTN